MYLCAYASHALRMVAGSADVSPAFRISWLTLNSIGNSASMPLTLGPTQPDSVTTVATRAATSEARSGISNQRRVIGGIRT